MLFYVRFRFIAFGAGEVSSKMSRVLQIYQDIFSDCGDGMKYEISSSEFTGRYYQASCNLQSFSFPVTPYHQFLSRLSKVDDDDLRVLALLKPLEKKAPTANFCGIFSLHACLNHSCMNNVEVCDSYYNDRGGVLVRAKRDITKGEELYTTYIDTSMPRKLRRAWLYKSFNFWCHCPRCVFEGDDPYVCTNCHTKSQDKQPFKGCGHCRRAWYCSVECQRNAWTEGHKETCRAKHSDTSWTFNVDFILISELRPINNYHVVLFLHMIFACNIFNKGVVTNIFPIILNTWMEVQLESSSKRIWSWVHQETQL